MPVPCPSSSSSTNSGEIGETEMAATGASSAGC
jgi:hypothetical protein